MKVPKKQKVSVSSLGDISHTPPSSMYDFYEYSHEFRDLAEIAGHVFNKYLTLEVRDVPMKIGKDFLFRFGNSNPYKTNVYIATYLSDLDLKTTIQSQQVKEKIYERSVDEIIHKMLNDVDKVNKLEKNLWARIKYVFTKSL